MQAYLHAPVTVTQPSAGILAIADEGIFAIQHELLTPAVSADPNVVIDAGVAVIPSADKLVIVTHGWLDKGQEDWPAEMAGAIGGCVDPNEWVCAAYDWKGGSAVVSSIQAAEYARDIAGPRLATAVLALKHPFKHVHLIGHSAGSWTIHAAAEKLSRAWPQATIHLTFLDAYVPSKWEPDELGHLFPEEAALTSHYWADHYYTKDITYKVTQYNLKHAHNIDISAIDPFWKEHEFPYRWYLATITGQYERWDEKKNSVYTQSGSVEYGFGRALEAGLDHWNQSLTLPQGNEAVTVTHP